MLYNVRMALKLKAKYVSVEDFKTYTGIDLYEELNEGQQPELFLRDCEDELLEYANLQTWRPINDYTINNLFTPKQKDALMEAILIQAKYVFENGDVLGNNGVDPEQGVKFGAQDREAASISPKAMNKLRDNGILLTKMRNRY